MKRGKIGISVLSFAHGHASMYCQIMAGFEDVRLLSVWDDDEERGSDTANRYGMRFSPHLEHILEDPEVDVVIIGSETNRHADLVEAAASAGKDILLQKPMALTLGDCDRIIQAVDRTKVYLSVAYQMRHDPSNRKIKELVDSGSLGRIGLLRRRHCIPVLFNPGFTEGKSRWHIDPEKNLGMFMDDASHAADFMYWILGKPVSVVAEIDNVLTEIAPDDTGIAVYRFTGKTMGILVNSSVTLAGENTTEVYGDQGVLIQNYDDLVSTMVKPTAGAIALKLFRRGSDSWEDLEIAVPASHGERIMSIPRAFLEAYKSDTTPPVSAVEGRVSVEMVLGAYQSAKEGRRVQFPLG
jgi:predicted dehydrogenase